MTRLSPDERRSALLDAGQAVFAARPFEAVSMAELARAAGVSKGLVYHYFDDKNAIASLGVSLRPDRFYRKANLKARLVHSHPVHMHGIWRAPW